MFLDNGYNLKVINLLEMEQSDCYNPFKYIRTETDVVKLITNLIANTTPKGSQSNDPFWEKAESLFLQAIFLYVWLEMPPNQRNFESVMMLLNEAEVSDNKKNTSPLDARMKKLEKSKLGIETRSLRRIENGERGASIDVLIMLSEIFGVTIDELVKSKVGEQ